MLLKNLKLNVCLMALSAIVFVSCSDDDPIQENPPVVANGAYILHSGLDGLNNSSLSYYDFETKNLSSKVYRAVNGKDLGDTGNSMIVYGSKMYIAVSKSAEILVTDKNGKLNRAIESENAGQLQKPRSLVAYEGKVYVTYYDGYLARIDTSSLQVEKQVKVGRYPEEVVVANKKLYVANSGGLDYDKPIGYDKTVSVIDINSFSVLKSLTVAPNPTKLRADSQGDVYVVANDYSSNAALQRIDAKTDVVTKIDGFDAPFHIAIHNDKMYIIQSKYDEFWNPTYSFSIYDAKNEKLLTNQFITDGTILKNPNCIEIEPVSGQIYIGDCPTYTGNGDVYIFSSEGKKMNKFDSGGILPVRICFVEK